MRKAAGGGSEGSRWVRTQRTTTGFRSEEVGSTPEGSRRILTKPPTHTAVFIVGGAYHERLRWRDSATPPGSILSHRSDPVVARSRSHHRLLSVPPPAALARTAF